MIMNHGFVYVWFDRKHRRYYVGSHWGREDDGYICSSSWMKSSYKRRPEDFRRRVVSRVYSSKSDLLKEEQRWLDMIKPEETRRGGGNRYFNLRLSTNEYWHTHDKRETRERMSAAWSEERKARQSQTKKAEWQSRKEELIETVKRTHWSKGSKSEETIAKLSENAKGRFWVHDPVTKRTRRVLPEEMPEGWVRGRG